MMILGYNLSLIWSSDSISVRCWFVDVRLIQRAVGVDLRMNVLQGPWTWSWMWIWADLWMGFWAWSLKNSDERISKGFWAWSWRTVGRVDLLMLLIQGAVGAWSWRRIWWRTKRAFLILRDLLESFRVSKLQGFGVMWIPFFLSLPFLLFLLSFFFLLRNECLGLLFIEFQNLIFGFK